MSEDATQLKVIVIGYGRMGERHADIYAASPHFVLAGICSREKQRVAIEAKFDDAVYYENLSNAIEIETPDLVCISTHIESHDELTRLALQNGCHVFLEKPVTESVFGSIALMQEAEIAERKLIVGHMLHHDQMWIRFCQACRELPGPVHLNIHLDQHSSAEEWEIHKKILLHSTIATDCAIHFFDMMSQALHGKILRVTGETNRTHDVESINDNYLSATVEFDGGSTGTYTSGWGPGFDAAPVTSIVASGVRETVRINEVDDEARIVRVDTNGAESVLYSEKSHLLNATEKQQEFVYQAITEGLDLDVHHRRTLDCMRVAEAADLSIAVGQPIELDV